MYRLQQLQHMSLVVVAPRLWTAGSVVMALGLRSSTACGIFLGQEMNPSPLHWQVGYYPLDHQASQIYLHKKEKNARSQIVVRCKKQCPLVVFPTKFQSQETTIFKSFRFSEFTHKFLKKSSFSSWCFCFKCCLSTFYCFFLTTHTHTDMLLFHPPHSDMTFWSNYYPVFMLLWLSKYC